MNELNEQKIEEYIFFSYGKHVKPPKIDFHLHKGCEIYFLLSGELNYFVEKKLYPLKAGELIITNNLEIHKPAYEVGSVYERYCLEFNAELLEMFKSSSFDLLSCFNNRPMGEQNKLVLNARQLEEVMGIFRKMEALQDKRGNGSEMLKVSYLVEVLVLLNRIFQKYITPEEFAPIHQKLVPILDYIDHNMEADLSLEALSTKFYIDRFYLSKLFKKSIGSSLHQYILYKRISRAKTLLASGFSVTDACTGSGFNDYSNFLKMFKRMIGVSPAIYGKKSKDHYIT